jgi:hypothetical protein
MLPVHRQGAFPSRGMEGRLRVWPRAWLRVYPRAGEERRAFRRCGLRVWLQFWIRVSIQVWDGRAGLCPAAACGGLHQNRCLPACRDGRRSAVFLRKAAPAGPCAGGTACALRILHPLPAGAGEPETRAARSAVCRHHCLRLDGRGTVAGRRPGPVADARSCGYPRPGRLHGLSRGLGRLTGRELGLDLCRDRPSAWGNLRPDSCPGLPGAGLGSVC